MEYYIRWDSGYPSTEVYTSGAEAGLDAISEARDEYPNSVRIRRAYTEKLFSELVASKAIGLMTAELMLEATNPSIMVD